jgi:hypothetical protein
MRLLTVTVEREVGGRVTAAVTHHAGEYLTEQAARTDAEVLRHRLAGKLGWILLERDGELRVVEADEDVSDGS